MPVSSETVNPIEVFFEISEAPMFEVMITIALRKSTVRPWASVSLPVLEDLQEDVEDVRVRLLDLVEEQHRVGLAPHGLGQLAALVVADVSRAASRPGG